jgi:hypothetical protein
VYILFIPGETSDAVHLTVCDMYREQEFGVIMLFTSIATTLAATGIQAIEILAPYISWPVFVVYAIGTFVLFFTGWNTFRIFHNRYHVSPAYIKKDQGKQLLAEFKN